MIGASVTSFNNRGIVWLAFVISLPFYYGLSIVVGLPLHLSLCMWRRHRLRYYLVGVVPLAVLIAVALPLLAGSRNYLKAFSGHLLFDIPNALVIVTIFWLIVYWRNPQFPRERSGRE